MYFRFVFKLCFCLHLTEVDVSKVYLSLPGVGPRHGQLPESPELSYASFELDRDGSNPYFVRLILT